MHTDEWRVEPGDLSTWTKVLRGSEKDDDLEIVAKTYAIEGYTATDVANLIAAAPGLLAALKQCLPLVDAYRRMAGGDGDVSAQLARFVIARAEGRSE